MQKARFLAFAAAIFPALGLSSFALAGSRRRLDNRARAPRRRLRPSLPTQGHGSRKASRHLQRQRPVWLARQQDESSRHDTRLSGPARPHRRHAEPYRPGRNPPDRQEVQELRGLHGGQAGLGLRQRIVPAIERSRRGLSGHARLPAGRRDGRHLRRAPDGPETRRRRGRAKDPPSDAERSAQAKLRARPGRRRGSARRGTPSAPGSKATCRTSPVWINGALITDFSDTANHAAGGATDGMIAIQMHFSNEKTPRWVDGGFWRWRNIAVKELPG